MLLVQLSDFLLPELMKKMAQISAHAKRIALSLAPKITCW